MHTRTKLKAIVVGSHGQQGREHIKILSDLVDLRAFVDTRADIEQISDVSQFTLLERALEREKRDVVIVNLPHYLHYQATHALMTAGVHVIKDKPLAMCADELVSYRNLVRSTHKLYLRSCSVDEDRRFAWRPRVSINWV